MRLKRPSIPYIIWMAVFTFIPIALILYSAFTDSSGGFTLEPFTKAFGYFDVFLRSLWIAFISTLICLVLAYPIGYIMSRQKKSTQNILTMVIMIPMWMNFLLRIYAWITLLQSGGPIDTMLSLLGIHTTLIGNQGAVILGMVYEYLPFMVLPLYSVMAKIDNNLIEAAEDLGSNRLSVMRKVVFPLSIPGIVSGVTMVFVPSASTFLVAQYLGGVDDIMIGDVIDRIFWSDQNTGAAIALILMAAIFLFLIILNFFGDEEAIA
ncbi:MAG: ABC transporter permease [Ruminococcus sp.]|jgi:spermidine/putrescine transport system permease protein|nr:ABC transporter permease [Ruminococcus sp.]